MSKQRPLRHRQHGDNLRPVLAAQYLAPRVTGSHRNNVMLPLPQGQLEPLYASTWGYGTVREMANLSKIYRATKTLNLRG